MRFIHNPRVYIYPIIVLCVCFFMQLHLKQIGRANGTNAEHAPVERIRQLPIDKPAEITSDSNLPKLFVFGDELSIPFAKDLRERLRGKCTVMHIVSSDSEMQGYFKIEQIPAIILFSSEQDEIARFKPPFSEDRLVEEVEAALKNASDVK